MEYMLLLAVVIYLMLGVVFAAALTQPGDDFVMWAVLLWPVVLLMLVLFGLINVCYWLGELIRKIFTK